jgi:hypothetical protein
MTAFGVAMTSLNAAMNIAKAMISLRDAAAFQSNMIEFQGKIIEAQDGVFAANEERAALIEQVRQLEEKVARLEAWETTKQRYQLTDVGGGQFTYALKVEASTTEPPHQLCANCFDKGDKSILQTETRMPGLHTVLFCQRCDGDLFSNETGGRHSDKHPPKRRR